MRPLTRLTTGAGLAAGAMTALLAAGAAPAHADPPCAGAPSQPATYVCVTSVTPQNAVPSIDPNGGTLVVPAFCYGLGCTADTPVTSPRVTLGSGPVAEVTYQGHTYQVPGSPGPVGGPDLTGLTSKVQNVLDTLAIRVDQIVPDNCVWYDDGTIRCS
jgi:hypothetical protein